MTRRIISGILGLAVVGVTACTAVRPAKLVRSTSYVGPAPVKPTAEQIRPPAKENSSRAEHASSRPARKATFPLATRALDPSLPESLAQIALVQYEKRDFVKAGQHFVLAARHPGATSREFRALALIAAMIAYLRAGPEQTKVFADTAELLRREVEQAADLVVDLEAEALLTLAATRGGHSSGPSRLPWHVRNVLNPMPPRTEVTR